MRIKVKVNYDKQSRKTTVNNREINTRSDLFEVLAEAVISSGDTYPIKHKSYLLDAINSTLKALVPENIGNFLVVIDATYTSKKDIAEGRGNDAIGRFIESLIKKAGAEAVLKYDKSGE